MMRNNPGKGHEDICGRSFYVGKVLKTFIWIITLCYRMKWQNKRHHPQETRAVASGDEGWRRAWSTLLEQIRCMLVLDFRCLLLRSWHQVTWRKTDPSNSAEFVIYRKSFRRGEIKCKSTTRSRPEGTQLLTNFCCSWHFCVLGTNLFSFNYHCLP